MKIKISADSTCDLPKDLAAKYGIGITPLYVVIDGRELRDGDEIIPEDIYRHVSSGKGMCSTAAVSYGDYMDVFGAWLEEYDEIVHFTISQSMSACYQNACMVAQKLGRIHVVDSASLSVGISMLAVRAAEMAAAGATADEIVAETEAMKERLDVSFVIETLEYLWKGGRCSAVAALGANLLHLRPSIELHGGAMEVSKKYRGALEKYIPKYLSDRLSAGGFDRRRAWIVDSGIDEGIRAAAIEQVKASGLFDEVLYARAGCTISNHCGPNTLGVIMMRAE